MNLRKLEKKPFKPLFAPLAGAHFRILQDLGKKYEVDAAYKRKWILTKIVSIISSIFAKADKFIWDRKKTNKTVSPLFIIGHWRSGTTMLHNAICQSGDVSYTSTYQGVFPNNLFFMKWLFKSIMGILMPKERPVDGVKINPDFPQEEEIALGNEIPFSFYYWFYFPRYTMEFAEKFLFGKVDHNWIENYRRFVKRCEVNRKGRFYISKNPPNTFRIKEILELYPDAKFIFIHRNPYDVFQSCRKFFWETIKGIQLQDVSKKDFENNTLLVYKKMMDKYNESKDLIPSGHLHELSYDELIQDPMKEIKKIESALTLQFDEKSFRNISKYLENRGNHVIAKYEYNLEVVSLVNKHWTQVLTDLGYEMKTTS